ncbi:MAG: GNAT family N-acetyltransferase [Erysipelotrichaceae bacterium]|nr:GNAT family N-acetyltransferase [Erysipelotrichaceae bacterium]
MILLKDGSKVEIRQLSVADAFERIKFRLKLAAETEATMNRYPEEVNQDITIEMEKIEDGMESPHKGLYAFKGSRIIGYCIYGPTEDTIKSHHRAYIGLGVLKKYTNQGLGTAFMEIVLKNLKEEGYTQAELEVVEDNVPAIALYEKFGFVEYGRRPNSFILKDGTVKANILMYKTI